MRCLDERRGSDVTNEVTSEACFRAMPERRATTTNNVAELKCARFG
jgi:hypothetical protein